MICPISSDVCKKQVLTKYDHIFEKENLDKWIQNNERCIKCPSCSQLLEKY